MTFNQINKDDVFYINFSGLKKYKNPVDRLLSRAYRNLLKGLSEEFGKCGLSSEVFSIAKAGFPDIKEAFPDFLPNMTISYARLLSQSDIENLLSRLVVYRF